MNYQEVLNIKRARLAKYSGGALRRKTRAYEKAVAKLVRVASKDKAPPTLKSTDTLVETGTPRWVVTNSEGTFTVCAASEKNARSEARKSLGVSRLPAGTKFKKVE